MKFVLFIVLLLSLLAFILASPNACNDQATSISLSVEEDTLSFEDEVLKANKVNIKQAPKQTGPGAGKPSKDWNSKLSKETLGNKFEEAKAAGILTGNEQVKHLAQFGLFVEKKEELKKCLIGNDVNYFCYLDCNSDVKACDKPNKVLAMYVPKQAHVDLCVTPRFAAAFKDKKPTPEEEKECYYRPCSCKVYEEHMMKTELNLYKERITVYQETCTGWCDSHAPPSAGIPFEVAEHQIQTIKRSSGTTFFAKTTIKPEVLKKAKFTTGVVVHGQPITPNHHILEPYFKYWTPFKVTRQTAKFTKGVAKFFAQVPKFAEIVKKSDLIRHIAKFQRKFKTFISPGSIKNKLMKSVQKVKQVVNKVGNGFKNVAKRVSGKMKKIRDGVRRRFNSFKSGFGRRIVGARKTVRRLKRFFGKNIEATKKAIKKRLGDIKRTVKNKVKAVKNKVKARIGNINRSVKNKVNSVKNKVKSVVSNTKSRIGGFMRRF